MGKKRIAIAILHHIKQERSHHYLRSLCGKNISHANTPLGAVYKIIISWWSILLRTSLTSHQVKLQAPIHQLPNPAH
ncbi:hypothetical protein [Nostoc cycadae]|uniref:hypothetical protein n=1 Tax=Nostoc cycadae TaxID=246795 RepID=UPI001650DD63|nr:hypothetical protein [Nostoc cycadae]